MKSVLTTENFVKQVVKSGTCNGCGLCTGLDSSGKSYMEHTAKGPRPVLDPQAKIPEIITESCAGYRINYPKLYADHYKTYPDNWLTGIVENVYVGYSSVNETRRNGSSGGVITQVLQYLLQTKTIDGAIVVLQGIPSPEKAGVFIARTSEEIAMASQSVYIPVSVLDILPKLLTGEKYAITCLPEQSAALRVLQSNGHAGALQIKYILGPYTGTAIYPQAIETFKKINGIKPNDAIVSLKWRAGEWPGYLEIISESGKIIRSPKIYYNFLIPFFVTNSSLQSMDFANEFADLAVGDAWSPEYEAQGQGFSVVVSRTLEMDRILNDMKEKKLLELITKEAEAASSMHGHMIDFKKRGSYIRNRLRIFFGKKAPDYGYKPSKIAFSRILVELFIVLVFTLGKTKLFRSVLYILPEKKLGQFFNFTRLKWKSISKPVKRKGLKNFTVSINKSTS